MRAMVCTSYGPPEVLQLQEVPRPEPRAKEIRVGVRATSVSFGDLMVRNFKAVTPSQFNMPLLFWVFARLYSGFTKPRTSILGSEFAGVVESAGKAVTTFKPGDEVFGYLGQGMGADAEYLCMPEDGCVARKPANLTFEEAAVAPYGAIMALELLRNARIQPGQRVLVLGASGGIGSAAVQLARHHFGARVTGVCSTAGLELVRSLGADRVVDYTKEDFTRSGETYALVFDVLGRSSFARCRSSLEPGGRYLLASFKGKQLLQMLWTRLTGADLRVICALAPGSAESLRTVKELLESGKLKSVVGRRFRLEQLAEAHRWAESGPKRGHVAISVA
ncbi:MAG: NAD(P)-dependent alcohol dehydrogenase [Deltaproteobacteria bacterium]|nr:NAD(P)-dependent alcohol dehydrogenase [Deltaproteobacteria bacterium]